MRRMASNGSITLESVRSGAPRFDYASLTRGVRAQVDAETAAIRDLIGDTLTDKIEIGRRLTTIRQAVDRFDFQPLVANMLGWTKATTSNYMIVARVFGKINPQRLARFHWSALVVLSRGTVPQTAISEALTRARAGQNIDKSLAESIVARHRNLDQPDPDAERIIDRLCQALVPGDWVWFRNPRFDPTIPREDQPHIPKGDEGRNAIYIGLDADQQPRFMTYGSDILTGYNIRLVGKNLEQVRFHMGESMPSLKNRNDKDLLKKKINLTTIQKPKTPEGNPVFEPDPNN